MCLELGEAAGAVELAVGDFADPASLRRAMEGGSRVFLSAKESADPPHLPAFH